MWKQIFTTGKPNLHYSVIAIDNQPIVFNQSHSCQYPTTYKQLVNQGDKTQFQFKLEVCTGSPDLVVNGGFNNGLNGWTVVGSGFAFGSGQTAIKTGTATSLIRQNILTIGNYYKCVVTVDAINSDESGNIAEVRIGSGTRFFPLELGVNELWGRCLGTPALEIRCNNNSQITVTSVAAFEVNTNYIVTIGQEDGTPLIPIYLEQVGSPYYNSTYFRIDRQFVTVTLDWNALSVGPGCYTIGVFDPCGGNATTNIVNYDFSQGNYGWTFLPDAGGGWEFGFAISPGGNGTAYFIDPASAIFPCYLYNSTVLRAGISYTVTYRISAIFTCYVQLYTGKFNPTLSADNTLTPQFTEGIYTETFTPSQDDSVMIISLNIFGGGSRSAVIDYISVVATNVTDLTPDFISEPIKLGNFDCTHLLRTSNDTDAFGFSYRDFAPRIRLLSDLRSGRDLSERKVLRGSSGRKKTYFADVIFAKDLVIAPIPEYVHNFLRYLTKSNYLYIDEISYFVEDDEYPDVSWNRQRSDGAVTLEVSENRLQLLQNCDGETTGGNSGSTGIGSPGGSTAGGTGTGVAIGTNEGSIIGIKS